jgi:hypothetical protein
MRSAREENGKERKVIVDLVGMVRWEVKIARGVCALEAYVDERMEVSSI